MHAVVNKVEGELVVRGSTVSFTPTSAEATEVRFDTAEVGQLLRSRKDDAAAKLVLEATSTVYIIRFDDMSARERFIALVTQSKSATAAGGGGAAGSEPWMREAICHVAVDVGLMEEQELQSVLAAEEQRGVVQAFDALETLVDRATLQLRPLTEQMENDILRAIPVLAAILTRRVVDLETKRAFWDAVVRKYFFFSRTFLEEELRAMEGETAAATDARPGRARGLAIINAASRGALPKASPSTARTRRDATSSATAAAGSVNDTSDDRDETKELESDLVRFIDGDVAIPHRRYDALFQARTRFVRCPTSGPLVVPAAWLKRVRAQAHHVEDTRANGPDVFTGLRVARTLPRQSANREVLELLRTIWRSGDDAHIDTRRMRELVSSKPVRDSFVLRHCVARVLQLAELRDRAHTT